MKNYRWKKYVSSLLAVVITVVMFFSLGTQEVNAAGFKWSDAKGSTDDNYSFFLVTINTKAKQSDYILLQHTNKMYYHSNELAINGMWYKHLRRSYGRYRITISNKSGHVIKRYIWNRTKKKKLTLRDFGLRKINFKKTYTYGVTIEPINAFKNNDKKQFLHWSGKDCNEYFSACRTPNRWKAGYKSRRGGIVKVMGFTPVESTD